VTTFNPFHLVSMIFCWIHWLHAGPPCSISLRRNLCKVHDEPLKGLLTAALKRYL